ncbi:hypothetical protein TorRG33x02_070180 [Trema orientale]|uniref:PB1-like domain-containing protein n=1 Tax=Trema orientale TaxID=63057 RepID=A0A2P5FHL7_TREOI|nr:hypothetical protein TorRG33x02_070180 [Trema orientale]
MLYVGGNATYVDWISMDYFGMFTLCKIAELLGLKKPLRFYYSLPRPLESCGFYIVTNDKECTRMILYMLEDKAMKLYITEVSSISSLNNADYGSTFEQLTCDTYDFNSNDFVYEYDLNQISQTPQTLEPNAGHDQDNYVPDLHDVRIDATCYSRRKSALNMEDPYYEQSDDDIEGVEPERVNEKEWGSGSTVAGEYW